MRARPACAPVAAAALLLGAATPRVCLAQRTASLEAGASWVHYDGFLAAGAGSLTGALAWNAGRSTLGLRGTLLAFETGHTSIQAGAGGAVSGVLGGPMRIDAGGDAAFSSYMATSSFAHLLGGARLRWHEAAGDVWAGPSAGRIWQSYGIGTATVVGGTAGASLNLPAGAVSGSFGRTSVGDTAWSDATLGLRLVRGPLEVAAIGGIRFGSSGAGKGSYGDAEATWQLGRGIALVLAGGRYPSDPVRGTIAGRYFTLALQLAQRTGVPRHVATLQDRAAPRRDSMRAAGSAPSITVSADDGTWIFTVSNATARQVEISGDFTSWTPLPLESSGNGVFIYRARLAAGLYRFNVRLDGGPWIVPAGVDSAPDDFGSRSALLVVPSP